MKILIYKRTHTGDPDSEGRFGIDDCMGTIRNLPFDAVIGVGGTGKEPQSYGIDRKVNWVGVNPQRKHKTNGARAGIVTFEKFALFEERGPLLHLLAPLLAQRMYAGRRFVFKSMTPAEHAEAIQLLKLADNDSSASSNEVSQNRRASCKPTKCVRKRRAKRCGKIMSESTAFAPVSSLTGRSSGRQPLRCWCPALRSGAAERRR